jgi:hypothetical protein
LNKRFGQGFSFNSAYTFGRSLDTLSSNIYGRLLDNPFNLRDNRGRSDFDRKHSFVASWLWSPSYRFRNPAERLLLGGWTVSAIHMAQSGSPLTIRMGSDVAMDGSGSRQHAAVKPGATITLNHANKGEMIDRYFNTDAFLQPGQVAPGTYGNSGRNILTGPGFGVTHFSAMKDFSFTERYKMQFRSEFFNLFNQAQFGCSNTTGGCSDPDNNVTSKTFGRIRSAGGAREIQFALKLIW